MVRVSMQPLREGCLPPFRGSLMVRIQYASDDVQIRAVQLCPPGGLNYPSKDRVSMGFVSSF